MSSLCGRRLSRSRGAAAVADRDQLAAGVDGYAIRVVLVIFRQIVAALAVVDRLVLGVHQQLIAVLVVDLVDVVLTLDRQLEPLGADVDVGAERTVIVVVHLGRGLDNAVHADDLLNVRLDGRQYLAFTCRIGGSFIVFKDDRGIDGLDLFVDNGFVLNGTVLRPLVNTVKADGDGVVSGAAFDIDRIVPVIGEDQITVAPVEGGVLRIVHVGDSQRVIVADVDRQLGLQQALIEGRCELAHASAVVIHDLAVIEGFPDLETAFRRTHADQLVQRGTLARIDHGAVDVSGGKVDIVAAVRTGFVIAAPEFCRISGNPAELDVRQRIGSDSRGNRADRRSAGDAVGNAVFKCLQDRIDRQVVVDLEAVLLFLADLQSVLAPAELGVDGILGVFGSKDLVDIFLDLLTVDGVGKRKLGTAVLHVHQGLVAFHEPAGLAERAGDTQRFLNGVIEIKGGDGDFHRADDVILARIDGFAGFQLIQYVAGKFAHVDGEIRCCDLLVVRFHGVGSFAHRLTAQILVSQINAVGDLIARLRSTGR